MAALRIRLAATLVCAVVVALAAALAEAPAPTAIVWLDIDSGKNTRPDHGWWSMNPRDPFTVPADGNQYRTMTSTLGLYSSLDPSVARQHAYQLVALGAGAVIVDWTNCLARREQSGGMRSYCDGIRDSTALLLREWSALRARAPSDGGFVAPKLLVAMRMPDMANLTRSDWLADEVFALHRRYPDAMMQIEDGSSNASRPALLAFIAPDLQNGWLTAPRWFDSRFNLRYTNGFISSWQNVTVSESPDWIYTDLPYWSFLEVLPRKDSPGYYQNLYRRRLDNQGSGSSVAVAEQTAIWCAVELCDAPADFHDAGQGCCGAGRPTPCRPVDGWAWDGWSNVTDGQITLQRQAASTLRLPVAKRPQYITINRWNYAVGWYGQPQEGLSRASSTFIEPSVEASFTLYNAAAQLVHNLTSSKALPPATPRVLTASKNVSDVRLQHPLWTPGESGAPTEICIYSPSDNEEDEDQCGDTAGSPGWTTFNYNTAASAASQGFVASSSDGDGNDNGDNGSGRTLCVVTRNFNGPSPPACVHGRASTTPVELPIPPPPSQRRRQRHLVLMDCDPPSQRGWVRQLPSCFYVLPSVSDSKTNVCQDRLRINVREVEPKGVFS
jgi:hypothetical protein